MSQSSYTAQRHQVLTAVDQGHRHVMDIAAVLNIAVGLASQAIAGLHLLGLLAYRPLFGYELTLQGAAELARYDQQHGPVVSTPPQAAEAGQDIA
ncbi:MAG: hypothetical protein ACREXX_13955 [Gammaproteobacteria bacterium]